jgi:hypothetical protein
MTQITTRHLAELLVGIARTQQAIIDAIESQKAGFKTTHLAPNLQTAARLRSTAHAPTLMDLPARVLLQQQSRTGPDLEQIARDLEALLASDRRGPQPPAAAGAGSS